MAIKKAVNMTFENINTICDEVSAGHVMIFDLAQIRDEAAKKSILSFLSGFAMASGTGLKKISMTNMMMTPAESVPFPKPEQEDDSPVKVHVICAADESDAPGSACQILGGGAAVVYNCENRSPEKTREDVDFISGFCYGIHGEIKGLADKLFLVVPEGVETDF